ncbi:uro-adherence factor A-like [Palaemon carinicauda]|uniref:uro-adherence factor A-like n=1 Tax=Palaemon carinicauda TaxID=392227 RepID=UPI0035B5E430
MDWFQVIFSALLINAVAAISLKCGEDIVVQRGQKKVLRFWSSEDELLNVDVLSKTKNATDAETDPLRQGQGEGGTSAGTVSSNTRAGSGSASGTTSSHVGGSSESNKFRTDIGTSNTDNDVREQNKGNDLYYSHKPNITSQHEMKINEDHQEVTSSPAFDQTNTPKFEDISKPMTEQIYEEITDIPPVIEVSTLMSEIEQLSDLGKLGNELPDISVSTQIGDDDNQTHNRVQTTTESILESTSNNLHKSGHENQFTDKADAGNVPGNTHTGDGDDKLNNTDSEKNSTFPEHNQGDSRTSSPDITDSFEIVTNPNVLFPDGNDVDELPVFVQTTEENNDHTESQTQSNLDNSHFDSIDYDEYAVPRTTYAPWNEQRQEHDSLGNISPEILDSIHTDNDKIQAHDNILSKTESISSNVQEQGEKNKITDNEKTTSIQSVPKNDKNKESELNFTVKNQISDSEYSETTISIINDLEIVTNPNVFSQNREGIPDNKEDILPGFLPRPEDNNRNKYHHIETHQESEPEKTHLDSVNRDEDMVESTTFGIWTEVRQEQQNVNNKIIPEQPHSQRKKDQLENSQQILNTNTDIPDLLTTKESFISTYQKKGATDTLFLEPEAFDTTTILYRKMSDDNIFKTTQSPVGYSEVTEEQMITTGISIESIINLDSSSEVSTTNPMYTEENETENPFLVDQNILHLEDRNDSMTPQKDIFTQQTTDRIIPITEYVTQRYDEIKKEPQNIVITERENEHSESATEITSINDQKPTEINFKIKMGDPLVSENTLFRMDELDILNEDSTTYNINEDIYNDEAPVVTTETINQTTDKYIEITTITAYDKNEHTKNPAIPNDGANGNEEGNVLVTHANSIHDVDNLSNLTITKTESNADLINESSLASENNTDSDYAFQESITESSMKNIQNDEKKIVYLPSTSIDIDDEVTEASIKQINKETDEVKWENRVEPLSKKEVPETEKHTIEQSNQENKSESDTNKISSTTSGYIAGNSLFVNSTTEKSTPVSQSNHFDAQINKVINPIATIPQNTNIKSDNKSKFNETTDNLQQPDKNTSGDEYTTPLVITTTKPATTTEIDPFASIIERWTEALENIPDEPLSIDDLVIDVSDFLDIKPDSSLEVIDAINNKLAEDIITQTRDPLLPDITESINDQDMTGTTEKGFLDLLFGINSSAMAGFLNTNFTQELQVPYTTQDTLFSYTDPITVIQTSTEKSDVTTDNQYKHEGDLKNSEHLNEPMDFFTITDDIHYQTTEADSTMFSTVNQDQVEITTINTADDQKLELNSPDSEKNSHTLTTIAPSSKDNFQTEMHETKSDTIFSPREELDEIFYDFYTDKPIEELTTSFPLEEITENDMASTGITTPFTIPLSVLKNPTILDNLLNGQVQNGESKVVINENNSHTLTTIAPSNKDNFQTEMHETKSDTIFSPREKLDEFFYDFYTDKPIEEQTISFPLEKINENDMASTGITTPFTIPLSVLKNPTILDNLLNGQVQNGESKVVTNENNSHTLTTIAPSSKDNFQTEMHETKSDTIFSPRDKQDEIFYDFYTGKPIEEQTTSFPLERITENNMASTGITTPFTIPLSVLKNPTILDNLLNGQVQNGGSKVVIKEQGSKVAISSPSQNDVYQPQAFTQESISEVSVTTSRSTTTNEYDQTNYFSTKSTTEAINQDSEQFTTEEIRDLHEKNSSSVNIIYQLNNDNEHATENPLTVDDISISNNALNEYLNIENLIHKNPDSYLGLNEDTSYPQVDESYNYNEDTVKNTATTNIPDTSARESTEPFVEELFNDETHTIIPHSSGSTTISLSSNNVTDFVNHPYNSSDHLIHPTVSLDETEVSLVNNKESQNITLTEHHQADNLMGNERTTTIQSETEESGNDSNFATIIIPPSIVNGLHGGHIKNDYIYTKTEAPIPEMSKVDTTTETTTEVTEMDHTTELPVTVATELLQTENIYTTQHSGVISRKEDEGQTDYGDSSPFFIRLPGSPDPVPLYIQYEPVEINYVPTYDKELSIGYRDSLKNDDKLEITNLFRDNIDAVNSVTEYANLSMTTDNGSYESFSNNSQYSELKSNDTDFFAVNTTISSEIENFTQDVYNKGIIINESNDTTKINNQHQELSDENKDSDYFRPNNPIQKRPDPFFEMEAPKLGNEEDKHNNSDLSQGNNSYSQTNQSEDQYSVDVSSQYGFESFTNKGTQPGKVEDVPLGINKEILYPGDYYLHDSYTDVNLKLLRNPVFSLTQKVKVITPSPEDLLSPQYTPFPITTNPPRHKPTASLITALPLFTSLRSTSANPETIESNLLSESDLPKVSNNSENSLTSEEPPVTTQRHPPSIEYSPIPAVDFDDSYALSYNPDSIFANEESIIAPYVNQIKGNFGNQEGTDQKFAEKKGQIDNGNSYSPDTYQAQNTKAHTNKNISPSNPAVDPVLTDNLPIPSEQFMAHKQVWAFPQSREDPAYLGSDAYNPEKSDGPVYQAFHSAHDFPGLNPADFSYRKVPARVSSHNTDSSPGKYDGHVIGDFNHQWSRPIYDDEVMDADDKTGDETLPTGHKYFHQPSSTWQENDTFPATQYDEDYIQQFFSFLMRTLPYQTIPAEEERPKRSVPAEGEQIFCEWNIRTEPGLYLIMTFHNLSAAYTVDCHGAYIEVERENNGYDARWCGSRVGQAGTRPHVIFAKSEVRITIYDDGRGNKVTPTGFEADIEVIDLFNKSDYGSFMRSNAYPHIRRMLMG